MALATVLPPIIPATIPHRREGSHHLACTAPHSPTSVTHGQCYSYHVSRYHQPTLMHPLKIPRGRNSKDWTDHQDEGARGVYLGASRYVDITDADTVTSHRLSDCMTS